MPRTIEFCDGPNCGWQRPVTEVVVEGKRKKLCDGCLKLVTDAKKTVADVVDSLLGPPTGAGSNVEEPPSASRALLIGFFLGILSGVAATLLVVRTP